MALLIIYRFIDCFGQSFPRNDGKKNSSLRGTKQSLYLINNTNKITPIFNSQKIYTAVDCQFQLFMS